MSTSPRTYDQALDYAQAEHANETQDWTGYCQRFVRTCYGIPALFESAWAQWLGADADDRVVASEHGNDPDNAPLGSALCFKGTGQYGHIMLAARGEGAWSNDLVGTGDIDYVDDRLRPLSQWGQPYLGYLTAVNDYDLQLRAAKPPKPKQTHRYLAVRRAIDRIEAAIENADRLEEKRDARMLRTELAHLRELYDILRHA